MIDLSSTITCPACGHQSAETMPTDYCQYIYDCAGCGAQLVPKKGDCCVYCSYGSMPCPPVQEQRSGSTSTACCGSAASPSMIADLSDRLVASVSQSGSARTSPGLYRALLRLLVRGQPVAVADLAATVGRPTDDIRRIVAGWTDTEYDPRGRIIGYGLTLRPTPHQFMVDGKLLFTWCALDTLFFPAVIQRAARVESPCADTGTPIRLSVDPIEGVTEVDPPVAVVSIATPESVTSVRESFCSPGRFFAGAQVAIDWQARHPGTHLVSVADAYEASRPLSAILLNETDRT